MNAAVITIGDEILIGQIIDTNSTWLGEQLNLIGIDVTEVRSIRDTKELIKANVSSLLSKNDVVIMTGGLGPTKDDVTKFALAELFEDELVMHDDTLAHIKALFEKRGRTIVEANYKQAYVPSQCEIIPNSQGTAPGMKFSLGKKVLYSLPGVPYEMQTIMADYILPALQGQSQLHIEHKTITVMDIPESILSEKIAEAEDHLPHEIALAYLPNYNLVRLRLTSKSTLGSQRDLLDVHMKRITDNIDRNKWIDGDVNHAAALIYTLKKFGKSLATAESCSGGMIAHQITSIPGCSSVYLGSTVTYQNELKRDLLHVENSHFTTVGAVSEEVVREMAAGVKQVTGADYTIATSGIAGPGGATSEKPVGTVWIGVNGPHSSTQRKLQLKGNRAKIIERTSLIAIKMLRNLIESDAMNID